MHTRRAFLKSTALSAGAAAISALSAEPSASGQPLDLSFAVFTKHLLGLSHERLADVLADIGATAIEAPVRPKGHVDPERVADDLPRFVEILKTRGIVIAAISSGINSVSRQQHSEAVLRTARSLGITRYRMNWYQYDLSKPIWPQLDAIQPMLDDLVALSKEVGILPCYQNHSGSNYVGAPVWDMAYLMRKHKPTELAWYFDIMHATVEGSLSWPIEANLVRDRLEVASFKDFNWDGKNHRYAPLGQGLVGRDYVEMLKKNSRPGVVCLHVEYLESLPRDEGYLPKAIAATKRDLGVLKSWFE